MEKINCESATKDLSKMKKINLVEVESSAYEKDYLIKKFNLTSPKKRKRLIVYLGTKKVYSFS